MPSVTFDLKTEEGRQERVHVIYGPETFAMICSCGTKTACMHMASIIAEEVECLTSDNAEELAAVAEHFRKEVVPVYIARAKQEELA